MNESAGCSGYGYQEHIDGTMEFFVLMQRAFEEAKASMKRCDGAHAAQMLQMRDYYCRRWKISAMLDEVWAIKGRR